MKKRTVIAVIIPALMLVFFARNLFYTQQDQLDSWMGGGMRMFGTIDKMLYRVSGFTVAHEGKTYFVNLRNVPRLKREDVKVRILPSEARLKHALSIIRTLPWGYDAKNDRIVLNEGGEKLPAVDLNAIQGMQVFRIYYNRETKEVSLKEITRY